MGLAHSDLQLNVLAMRFLIIFILMINLVLVADAAQEKPGEQNQLNATQQQKARQSTITVNVVHPPKTEDEKREDKEERDRKVVTDDNLVKFTGQLAKYTRGLFIATIVLAIGTLGLWWFAKKQSKDTKQSLVLAKESADIAFKAAMPILSPLMIRLDKLHPLAPINEETYDANIFYVFENYGKTPGMIRELRANLFHAEFDKFPKVDFSKLTQRQYNVIVPGNMRGDEARTAAVDHKQTINVTAAELTDILAEAVGRYRRFALIGCVIYDDLFGFRHTRTFCIKLRLMPTVVDGEMQMRIFQILQGGVEYGITTEK